MPFKYKLFTVACYGLIAATAVAFFYILSELSNDSSTPFWGFVLLIIFFGCYFGFPALGISLIKDLRANQEASRRKRIWIRIIFFVLIPVQGLTIYGCVEIIQLMIRYMNRNYVYYTYDSWVMVFDILIVIMCLLTIYLQIIIFPLMRSVKENYTKLIEQLNRLGTSEQVNDNS